MTILPLTYLGNIEYFAALCSGGDTVIDLGENYVKQTYRNRCEIMTDGGIVPLTVNVARGRSIVKKPVCDVRIDYSKRWQHQHKVSIISAYGNSPYFEHYRERFAPLYEKEFVFLADLNARLLEVALGCLGLSPGYRFSNEYIHAGPADRDMRGSFNPVSRDSSVDRASPLAQGEGFRVEPYYQVFSDKHPFAPNLSVIDLIFCEGPAARGWILP